MTTHQVRDITFREAVRVAITEEMERQQRMVIIGEDLLPGGGSFGVHLGRGERFGARMFERCRASARPEESMSKISLRAFSLRSHRACQRRATL